MFYARMGRKKFQKIYRAIAGVYQMIPKAVVATGPYDPVVSAFDLIDGELFSAIHAFEVVLVGCGKTIGFAARGRRFVLNGPRGGPFVASRNHENRHR